MLFAIDLSILVKILEFDCIKFNWETEKEKQKQKIEIHHYRSGRVSTDDHNVHPNPTEYAGTSDGFRPPPNRTAMVAD